VAYPFQEGFATVKLNGKFGIIDKNGKEITSIKYDDADAFVEGIVLVKLNGKKFYLDKNGTEYYEP
jgi:hypothetical protein